jgi:superfamily II DNA/RNA helicase
MPLTNGEGPIGLIICPSRELARQVVQSAWYSCSGTANAQNTSVSLGYELKAQHRDTPCRRTTSLLATSRRSSQRLRCRTPSSA